jgi:hypothetical protein
MATTTNYSWATPDDTDLVKDGAAAIRTLGSSVDTTTKALNPSTTEGDIEYRSATADTNSRLAIGTAGQVLTVNSGATAPEWAPVAAGGGLTLLSTTTLSGASVTLSSISQSYKNLQLVFKNVYATAANWTTIRYNSDTGSNYSRRLFELGGSTLTGATTVQTNHLLMQVPSTSGNNNGFALLNLPDYTTASGGQMSFSTSSGISGATLHGAINNGVYFKSAEITSITISMGAGDFSGGTVLLYGEN